MRCSLGSSEESLKGVADVDVVPGVDQCARDEASTWLLRGAISGSWGDAQRSLVRPRHGFDVASVFAVVGLGRIFGCEGGFRVHITLRKFVERRVMREVRKVQNHRHISETHEAYPVKK